MIQLSIALPGENNPSLFQVLETGFNPTFRVGEKGKHATQSWQISVKSSLLGQKLFSANQDNIFAKVIDGDVTIFEGVVRNYKRRSVVNNYEEPISIQIDDYSSLMNKYIYSDLGDLKFSSNFADSMITAEVFINMTLKNLIKSLLQRIKIDQYVDLEIPELEDEIIQYFSLDAGSYFNDSFETLLFEYNLDYVFSPGKLKIIKTNERKPLKDIPKLKNKVSVSADDIQDDGLEVSYGEYQEADELLHKETYTKPYKMGTNWALWQNGYFYSSSEHINGSVPTSRTCTWDALNKENRTILYVKNPRLNCWIDDEKGITISQKNCDSYDNEGGICYYYFSGQFNSGFGKTWTHNLEVYGTVVYKYNSEFVYKVGGVNPTKYQSKYVLTMERARALAETIDWRNKTAIYKYQFYTMEDLEVGGVYTFVENEVSGVSQIVRIISKTKDFNTGLYSYSAEGAGDVEVSEIIVEGNNNTEKTDDRSLLTLRASKTAFFQEAEDEEINFFADGTLLTDHNCIPVWKLNGATLAGSGTNQKCNKSDLKQGINTIEVSAVNDGMVYKREIQLVVSRAESSNINFKAIIISKYSNFYYTWYEKSINDEVVIELLNNTSNIPVWTVDIEGTDRTSILEDAGENRKRILVSSLSEAEKKAKEIRISVSINDGTNKIITSFTVSNNYEEMPAPMYCGMVTNINAKNAFRASGYYADNDYVLYNGITTTDDNVDGTLNSGSIYSYSYALKKWSVDNSPSNSIGAMNEILATTVEGAEGEAFQTIKNLVSNTIIANSITVKSANVSGKISINQLDAKDENGEGFDISSKTIKATSKDGSSAWCLNNDGTGYIKNISITGKLSANAIDHEALTTLETQTGNNAIEEIESDAYWQSSVYQALSTNGMHYSPNSIFGTFSGLQVNRICVTEGVPTPSILTSNGIGYGGSESISIGKKYTSSRTVSAGNSHDIIKQLRNDSDKPIYVEASCSLSGNMNSCYIYLKHSEAEQSKGSSFRGWLLPGEHIGVWGKSWAWWGSQTASCEIKTYAHDGTPYLNYDAIRALGDPLNCTCSLAATKENNGKSTAVVIGTVSNIDDILNNIYAVTCVIGAGSVFDHANLEMERTSDNTCNIVLRTSIYSGTVTHNETNDEGEDASWDETVYYKGSATIYGIGLIYQPNYPKKEKGVAVLVENENGKYYLQASYKEENDFSGWRKQSTQPTILKTNEDDILIYDSADHVTKVFSYDVIDFLIEKFGEAEKTIRFNSAQSNYIKLNNTTFNNIVSLVLTSQTAVFKDSGAKEILIDRNTLYDYVELNLYSIAEEKRIETADVIPKINGVYNIGKEGCVYNQVRANDFYGNVNNSGTVYKVWGAVAN